MADRTTDYLVVGAGVSGMGFVDAMSARRSDLDFIVVDKRHSPGGHWNDVYPFVRLHQPAVLFGADSIPLLDDRIDDQGPNAGFYQLATAPEVLAHYGQLLDEFDRRGNVSFCGGVEYLGPDGDDHVLRSVVTGETSTVSVRRRLVDTTYMEPTIPLRHTPAFGIDVDARVVPPNSLVHLGDVPSGFTVLGAGKTSMDAVSFLLAHGVDPDAIRWVRPRDAWVMRRAATQPLQLIANGFMKLQGEFIKAAALAEDPADIGRRLEAGEVLDRLDPSVEPTVFRGATLSQGEVDALRQVRNVVRLGRVVHVGASGVKLEQGALSSEPGHVYVDCTAEGFRDVPERPVFEGNRITMQMLTLGNVSFSAATIGTVEALVDDDGTRNAMCAPLGGFGTDDRVVSALLTFLTSAPQRMFHPEIGPWMEGCRLNSARVLPELRDDPVLKSNEAMMFEHLGGAIENLTRLAATPG